MLRHDLEDFIAKFVGVKYVIDPGTSKEKVYVIANDNDLGVVSGGGFVVANPIRLGSLKPLSIGEHVVESYLLFSAMHCDGLGQVVAENCLGPGEVLFPSVQLASRLATIESSLGLTQKGVAWQAARREAREQLNRLNRRWLRALGRDAE